MTTAQPEQMEQRMVIGEKLLCNRCGKAIDDKPGETYCGSTDGRVWHYGCAPSRNRPTADLGEDGELPAPSIFDLLEPLAEALVANGGPDIRYSFARGTGGVEIGSIVDQVRDRLILYREALERVEKLVAVLTNCALRNEAADIISAALSRSEADATRIKDQSHGG